jgi:hypothetical protein
MPLSFNSLSNSSGAVSVNREGSLLLVGILASSSINLVLAIEVSSSALVGVVLDSVLQLQDVGAGSGVDVRGVARAGTLALALDVVLVLEAAGARGLLVGGGGEADVEAVVAAGGAAENELVDEERAVGLGVGAAAVVAAAVGGGGGSSGGKGGGTESEDGGGTHFDVVGLVFKVLLEW